MDQKEYEELMQEPVHGHNHGRAKWGGPANSEGGFSANISAAQADKPRELDTEDWVSIEFLADGSAGWDIASMGGGAQQSRGGFTSHRGVLHPDEYVHAEVLEQALEDNLGISLEQFDQAYRSRGKPSAETIAIKERVDLRLLEVVETGGNVALLSRVLGIKDQRIYDAAERARARRAE